MRYRAPEVAFASMSWTRMGLLVGVSIILALTIEPALGLVLPVAPAIPLAVVGIIAAHNGAFAGVAAGLAAGFALDLLGGGAVGVQLGSHAVAGYAVGRAIRYVPAWPVAGRLVVVTPLLALQAPVAAILARIAGSAYGLEPRTVLVFIAIQIAAVLCLTPVLAAIQPGPQRA